MLASRQFRIKRKKDDDWFHAILNADTKLFIDPFLLFKETKGVWAEAHKKIIRHFDIVFTMISSSNFDRKSLVYQKALHLLTFREPKELCLGYTAKGTRGSGGGRGYAETIAEAIEEAIKRGLQHPKHFEELGILNEGIGSDRISDITATILKEDLIRYTRTTSRRHRVPLASHRIYASQFDERRKRWADAEVNVPTNPFSEKAFLFVPERFIRDLPTLNADDWFDSFQNEQLRQDLNYEIMTGVRKADIVKAAREHPEAVRKWTRSMEAQAQQPYDLNADKNGVYQWEARAEQFTNKHPITLSAPTDADGFFKVINRVVAQFKLFIEQQGGWSLLWNDGSQDKPEEAAQLLFRGIVQHYCHANNIEIDREVELGRGPVDFKFSSGYVHRAHLEIKKLHNGKFWNGLELQLPSYMRSDGVTDGWFLAIRYREGRAAEKRARELPKRVIATAKAESLNLMFALVDARRPLSASNL
jgi:hypothetical protein